MSEAPQTLVNQTPAFEAQPYPHFRKAQSILMKACKLKLKSTKAMKRMVKRKKPKVM